ncbi:MAG: hypothetical protein ACKVQS_07810 [Fimbriimonadaceae bacterium]
MSESENLEYSQNLRRFTLRLAIVLTVIVAIPWILAAQSAPAGSFYIGSQFSTDDQMVYAAWMHQAMNGSFLFDNRFAIESQPGLTAHLYFWLLGTFAIPFKSLGSWIAIPLISNLARIAFTFLFVVLLGRFVRKIELPIFVAKSGMILATLGGGIGFMMWQAFGRIADPPKALGGILDQRLPIDVWQPEAFVFASSLVNGLFMVSLCLIITVITQIWDAQKGWRAVPLGAAAMLLLMNIHSYDVLIIAFTMTAFAAVLAVQKSIDWKWAIRALVIGLGAIPAALWYLNVLKNDPVFQARAATLTYSGTFRQLLFGILPLFILGVLSFRNSEESGKKWYAPVGTAIISFALFVLGSGYDVEKTYFLTMAPWLITFVAICIPLYFGPKSKSWQLLAAWAAVGLILPYFPQLFQRKLAMGLVIPWAFLAAYGFDWLANLAVPKTEVNTESFRVRRNLVTGIIFLLCCASSIYWFQREFLFIRNNVSVTTMQPIFLSSDVSQIISKLESIPGRKVVVARPGVASGSEDSSFPHATPYLPDLNSIFSGYAGAYTYAGHWSETPDYDHRRYIAEGIFQVQDPTKLHDFIKESQADYLVQPIPDTFPDLKSNDLSTVGEVIFQGTQYRLIKVDKTKFN